MSPLLKLLLELGPLAVFFITFNMFSTDAGGAQIDALIWATGAFMIALTAAAAVSYALTRSISKMTALTTVIVLVMGGLTIWLRDEVFIKMKPTMIYTLFAVLLGYGLWRGESYLKLVMGEMLPLRQEGWMKLTRNWALCFLALAVANEIVWRSMDTDSWVWVKTFVYLPAVLIFAFSQTPLMARYAIDDEAEKKEAADAGAPEAEAADVEAKGRG